jgi:hypothetical protein
MIPLSGPCRFLVGEAFAINIHESYCPVRKPEPDDKWVGTYTKNNSSLPTYESDGNRLERLHSIPLKIRLQ